MRIVRRLITKKFFSIGLVLIGSPQLNRKGEINIANMDRLGLSPVPSDDVNVIMKKSQTRMWKTLQGEPQFIISVAET